MIEVIYKVIMGTGCIVVIIGCLILLYILWKTRNDHDMKY
jgi:hypothetical protein